MNFIAKFPCNEEISRLLFEAFQRAVAPIQLCEILRFYAIYKYNCISFCGGLFARSKVRARIQHTAHQVYSISINNGRQ